MKWLKENADRIVVDGEEFETWLGIPCDVESDEEEMTVECRYVEELHGYDGEADEAIQCRAEALREIKQVTKVVVSGRTCRICFSKPLSVQY